MKHDYEIVNGKPHFGIYFANYLSISGESFNKDNPLYECSLASLNNSINNFTNRFEIRNKQVIERPPLYSNPLCCYGTLAIKYMVWGRAFEVMRIHIKQIKRYKKKLVNGRRKWVRVDKR